MLTTQQISLVQESFARVLPHTEAVATDFYNRLFDLAPDTRPLFRNDMVMQGEKLFLMLAAVVDTLEHLDRILPTVRNLAVRHVAYGTQSRHYDAVGEALIGALRAAQGDSFDDDTARAWAAAYAILATEMIAAADVAKAA